MVSLTFPYKNAIKTITTDNGPEFADHLTITRKIGVTVNFTDPYSSWQKGCIGNSNILIRQYIPKKTNFNDFSDGFIKKVQKKINLKPREKLNFSSPKKCSLNILYKFALWLGLQIKRCRILHPKEDKTLSLRESVSYLTALLSSI